MANTRLSPDDWLCEGFRALAEDGPVALKAEPLARRMKTTKGSFYWHFADVPAFHAAMMARWMGRAAEVMTQVREEMTSPVTGLRELGRVFVDACDGALGGVSVEPAIRAWARSDKTVADAVARVDNMRLAHLKALLGEIKLTNPTLPALVYGASIGIEDLGQRAGTAEMDMLIDLVLSLRG